MTAGGATATTGQTLSATVLVSFGGVIANRVARRRIPVRTFAVAVTMSLLYVFTSSAPREMSATHGRCSSWRRAWERRAWFEKRHPEWRDA